MPKSHRPEEFFEVFKTARKEKAAGPDAPSSVPAEPPAAPAQVSARPSAAAPAAQPARAAQPPAAATQRKFPMSVFAEDEPTVTIRRSTLIFAIIVGLILLFIAYRVGRSTAPKPRMPQTGVTTQRDGVTTTLTLALPAELRNTCAVSMKYLDHTQDAGPPNARTYRDFLNTAGETAFIREAGKKAFIISYEHQLAVCVGPFDHIQSPEIALLLPRLRTVRFQGVQQFAGAAAEALPQYGKLFQ